MPHRVAAACLGAQTTQCRPSAALPLQPLGPPNGWRSCLEMLESIWARCCCCRPPMRPATNVAEDQPSHHGATASRPTQQRNDKQRMRRAKLRSLPPVPLPMGRSDHCSSLLPFHAATVSLIKGAVECQTRSRLRVRRMQGPSEGASRRGLCRGGVGRVKRGGWRARAEAKTIFVWTGRTRFKHISL